jgi:hypothetical protein
MFFEARLICLCALVLVVPGLGLGVCRLVLVAIYIIDTAELQYSILTVFYTMYSWPRQICSHDGPTYSTDRFYYFVLDILGAILEYKTQPYSSRWLIIGSFLRPRLISLSKSEQGKGISILLISL